jgi:DNA-binding MarR family transcriptional regulator
MNSETLETAEYLILENIYSYTPRMPPLNQRELARAARTSLGLTNSILKRLAQKG